jgi:hypothetical protein
MSLYRQSRGARGRAVTIAAVIALLGGGALGFVLGRSTAPEPSIAEQVADLQARVEPALDGLALVPDHYAQGLEAGGSVQYEGSVQQAEAAHDAFTAEAADLRAVNPAGYEAAEAKIEELLAAIEARKPPAEVKRLAAEAEAAVAAASAISEPDG